LLCSANKDYNQFVPKRRVRIAPDAKRQFSQLPAADRARLRDAIKACLEEDDAAVSTRNRFPLRRSSELAHFELRVDDLRVFYRIAGEEVQMALIGRKKGNELYIEGKKVKV
jgi:mRNA-degrading endonuclease RelE of RelBE toxin-antitoxin system